MKLLKDINPTTDLLRALPPMDMSNKSSMEILPTANTSVELRLVDPGDARYFGVFIGIIVVLFGITGNGITVWAYTRNRNLQTSFNILIANLCLVEVLFSLIIIPSLLPGYIAGYNLYPKALCSIVGYFYYASLASSLYNLVAIAVNRYVGIVKSKNYQKLFTGRRLRICIATIWIIPAVLYLPVAVGGGISWRENTLRCAIGERNMPIYIRWYNFVLNITFQAVPLFILIILYTAIFHKVKQVKEKMKGHTRSSRRSRRVTRDNSTASSVRSRNRSGTVSDDTGDEMKPSSLIEGIGLNPVQHSAEQPQTPVPGTPQKTSEAEETNENSKMNDQHNDNDSIGATISYHSDEEEREKPPTISRKRNSIWNLLLRNSIKANEATLPESFMKAESPTLSVNTDHHSSGDETSAKTATVFQENNKKDVELRENAMQLKNMHRKRSLSVPNLPHLDFTNPDAAKFDTRNFKKSPSTIRRYLNVPGTETSFIYRSDSEQSMGRTKSAYVKRKPRDRTQSDTDPRRSKTSWSVRVKKTTKEWASNLSVHNDSDNESLQGHRPRLGTIARKVQEKRHRAEKRDEKSRYQRRILKKRQARERQLVYSSFTICIAFAVCIMPTSVLYLTQIVTGINVSASVVLIVGCIAWLHAVVNPIIYGYLNSQYRREYKKMARAMKMKLFKADTNIPKSKPHC